MLESEAASTNDLPTYQVDVLQPSRVPHDRLALLEDGLGSLGDHRDPASEPTELEAGLRGQPGSEVVRRTGREESDLKKQPFFLKKFGNAENRTQAGWLRSVNATSVLC